MENTPTGSVENEVERGCEGEEGDEMEGFVGLLGDVWSGCRGCFRESAVRKETGAGREQEDYEECDCESC